MTKALYLAAGVLVAGLTFAGSASVNAAPVQQSGLTQDLSARCRVIIERRWRHGHRVTVKRTVCTRRHRDW
jgi:hypothetical protein